VSGDDRNHCRKKAGFSFVSTVITFASLDNFSSEQKRSKNKIKNKDEQFRASIK
jgi:hypothetical protein